MINFIVNSPKGSMFLKSVNGFSYSKTGEKMFQLLSKCVEKIGVRNVVQVVIDSTSNNVLAGMKFIFVICIMFINRTI